MAVNVTLTFDTLEQMLEALSGRTLNPAPVCCLGPDDGREAFTTPMAAAAAAPASPPPATPVAIDTLIDLLEDPKFTVRTMSTLMEKTGLMEEADVFNLLDKHGVDYITQTRRRDSETLVGLSSRN